MQVYLPIAERRLSYAKITQARAMQVYLLIAERRLSYAKITFYFHNAIKNADKKLKAETQSCKNANAALAGA